MSTRAPLKQLPFAFSQAEPLTVLSFGAGQDSTLLLYLAALSEEFRARWIVGRWIAILADTGNEHDHTQEHVAKIKRYTQERGIEFYHLTPDLGFHSPKWQSLTQFYQDNNAIGSKAYPKTCTDRLKIQPFYNFLERYLADHYGTPVGRRRGFYKYVERGGTLRVLIGIAADEAGDRIGDGTADAPWMRRNIEKAYPLVEMGYDRARCQAEIARLGFDVPWPSNCVFCPFVSKIELLWLARRRQALFEEWVRLEANKLLKWSHLGEKNLGVFGSTKALPTVLEEVMAEFGHMTDEELDEYKFSHGHCVKSKY